MGLSDILQCARMTRQFKAANPSQTTRDCAEVATDIFYQTELPSWWPREYWISREDWIDSVVSLADSHYLI